MFKDSLALVALAYFLAALFAWAEIAAALSK
jgi:hypothetical protein